MDTGIGVLIEVQSLIVQEGRWYPAQHRYGGWIITPADEVVPFVTDRPVPSENLTRAVGRRMGQAIEVADFITASTV